MSSSFISKLEDVLSTITEKKEKTKKDACYYKAKRTYRAFPSAYASGFIQQCRNKKKRKKRNLSEGKFDSEKKKGLKGWFDRNDGKGWIDCKASRKGKLVPCGRKKTGKGAERAYPACRPTLSSCTSAKKKKTSSKPISWD